MRELIRQALVHLGRAAEGNSRLSDHMAALVRTPSYGSFVEGLDTWHVTGHFLLSLDWTEIDPAHLPIGTAFPGCRYFVAPVPEEYEAFENIATYTEACAMGLDIKVEEGKKPSPETGNPQGLRLSAQHANPQATNVIHMILGATSEDDDSLIPWAWHPGRILAPLAGKAVAGAERLLKGEDPTVGQAIALRLCAVHLSLD